jgi:hypothetical protein
VAIKNIGVEGRRLEGSKRDSNQDFVMVNGPTFDAPNTKDSYKSLKLLAPTTDRIPDVKKGVSADRPQSAENAARARYRAVDNQRENRRDFTRVVEATEILKSIARRPLPPIGH